LQAASSHNRSLRFGTLSARVMLCYHDTQLPHTAVALVTLPPHKFASTSLSFQTVGQSNYNSV